MKVATPAAPSGEPAQQIVETHAVARRWWTLFRSPVIDRLEAEALARNADLAAADASLRGARALYQAQRAAVWPVVQLGAGASRARNSGTIASPLASNAQTYDLFAAQLGASYLMDVFGAVRRQTEAAAAQAQAQGDLRDAVQLTLTANVAAAALQIAGLDSQLAEVEAAIVANRQILAILHRQQAAGEASAADVAAAEGGLETAEQAAPPLRRQIGLLKDVLAVYLGRSPASLDLPDLTLADVTLPVELPLTLPSELVRQRPDVRAAEANLHAASAQLGVAVAARLPVLTLGAAAGGTATRIGQLFASGNSLWSFGAAASGTVFDGGALKYRQAAARAALDQAGDQYRGVVLAALQGTADVLQSIDADADALDHAARSARAADRALQIARAQERAGQAGALVRLNAEIAARQAGMGLAQARAARFADTVALYQALGGGWSADTGFQGGGR